MLAIVMHRRARAQIRTARMKSRLSLRELGRRVGVSASLLSQIENGKSDPSVSTLYALVAELGLSLDTLLEPESLDVADVSDSAVSDNVLSDTMDGPKSADTVRRKVTADVQKGPQRQSPVVLPGERRILRMDSGVVWERLTRGPSEFLDALLVTYEPKGTSSSNGQLMTHSGLEFAYLMEGELTLQLGFETHMMKAGDSLQFESSTPHLYYNAGTVPAKGLWYVMGRETVPAQDGVPRLMEDSFGPAYRPSSAVEVLQAFSRE